MFDTIESMENHPQQYLFFRSLITTDDSKKQFFFQRRSSQMNILERIQRENLYQQYLLYVYSMLVANIESFLKTCMNIDHDFCRHLIHLFIRRLRTNKRNLLIHFTLIPNCSCNHHSGKWIDHSII